MVRWEYLVVKVHDFGSDDGERKAENEYWVSEYGLPQLINKLGLLGWETSIMVHRDVIMKRELAVDAGRAAVEMASPQTASA